MHEDADLAATRGLAKVHEYRPNLLGILALTQLKRGNDARALEMAHEVARQYPNQAQTYALLSQIHATRKQWEKAHEYAERYAELEGDSLAYLVLATTQYQLKRYEGVVASVSRALKLEPDRIGNAVGVTEGVYALIGLDRRGEARTLLKRHIAANPRWRESTPMLRAATELGVNG